eukprot:COSAG01_NODE_2148_length_8299_cov_283.948177_10_plen_215_part_00
MLQCTCVGGKRSTYQHRFRRCSAAARTAPRGDALRVVRRGGPNGEVGMLLRRTRRVRRQSSRRCCHALATATTWGLFRARDHDWWRCSVRCPRGRPLRLCARAVVMQCKPAMHHVATADLNFTPRSAARGPAAKYAVGTTITPDPSDGTRWLDLTLQTWRPVVAGAGWRPGAPLLARLGLVVEKCRRHRLILTNCEELYASPPTNPPDQCHHLL